MGDLSKNFSLREFECKCGQEDCIGYFASVSHLLINYLQAIRDVFGKPITITSGIRCPEYNDQVGGAPDSPHLNGDAADILCGNSMDRHELVALTHKYFSRVGIGKDFIHVDVSQDVSKPQEVTWTYYEG